MYIMYVDESGDTGLVNSPTRYFGLSGIVVHESQWRLFINQLIAHRRVLKQVYGLPIRGEIHASVFVNKSAFGLKRHVRLAILRNTLDELAKMPFISITNVIVNKANKAPDYDVFEHAWLTLFQRFENTLKYGNFPQGRRLDCGLVVTDATAGHKLTRLVRRMAVHNPIPNDQRFNGGFRNLPIERIIEDPHGKNSAETLPIQMADVTAYFLAQRYAPNSFIRRQRAQRYFDRLGRVLNTHATRFNPLGIVEL